MYSFYCILSSSLWFLTCSIIQFISVQLLSHVWPFETPWTVAWQASLSITNSQSLLKLVTIESVMPSNHCPLWSSFPPAFNLSHRQGIFQLVHLHLSSVPFSSVAQSCLTLCDPMNRTTPGLPVHHQLPEFTQTHVHRVRDAPAISSSVAPFSSYPQSFPASGSFPMSQFFASDGQSFGLSASASVLPMNMQDWFPLGWTGWSSLQSKGLSRVFSNTTV